MAASSSSSMGYHSHYYHHHRHEDQSQPQVQQADCGKGGETMEPVPEDGTAATLQPQGNATVACSEWTLLLQKWWRPLPYKDREALFAGIPWHLWLCASPKNRRWKHHLTWTRRKKHSDAAVKDEPLEEQQDGTGASKPKSETHTRSDPPSSRNNSSVDLSSFERVDERQRPSGQTSHDWILNGELPVEQRKRKAFVKGQPISTTDCVASISIHCSTDDSNDHKAGTKLYTPSVSVFAMAGNAVTTSYTSKCVEVWRLAESLQKLKSGETYKPWINLELPAGFHNLPPEQLPLFTHIETTCPGVAVSSSPEMMGISLWACERSISSWFERNTEETAMGWRRCMDVLDASCSNVPNSVQCGAVRSFNRARAKYTCSIASLSANLPLPYSNSGHTTGASEALVWLNQGAGGLVLASSSMGYVYIWPLPACLVDANGNTHESHTLDSSLTSLTNLLSRQPIASVERRYDKSRQLISVVSIIWLGYISDLIPSIEGEIWSSSRVCCRLPSVETSSPTQMKLWRYRYCPFFAVVYSDSRIHLHCLVSEGNGTELVAIVDAVAALHKNGIIANSEQPRPTHAMWNPSYLGVRPIVEDSSYRNSPTSQGTKGIGIVVAFEDTLVAQFDILRGYQGSVDNETGGALIWHSKPPICRGLNYVSPSCMTFHPTQPVLIIGYRCKSYAEKMSSFRLAVLSGTTGNVDHFLEKPLIRASGSQFAELSSIALDSSASRLLTSLFNGKEGEVTVWDMHTQQPLSSSYCSHYVSEVHFVQEISPVDWPLERALQNEERPPWSSRSFQHVILTMFGPKVELLSYKAAFTRSVSNAQEQRSVETRGAPSRSSHLARKFGNRIPGSKKNSTGGPKESATEEYHKAHSDDLNKDRQNEDNPTDNRSANATDTCPSSSATTTGKRKPKTKARLGKLDKESNDLLKRAYYGDSGKDNS